MWSHLLRVKGAGVEKGTGKECEDLKQPLWERGQCQKLQTAGERQEVPEAQASCTLWMWDKKVVAFSLVSQIVLQSTLALLGWLCEFFTQIKV